MGDKKATLLITLAFIAALAGVFAFDQFHPAIEHPASTAGQNVYERIMGAQTMRCGYGIWPPFIIKDPNSGQMSGIFHDYLEALGEKLRLKIEWTEEVAQDSFAAALDSGRIDGVCASIWPDAARARAMDFTRPIYYSAQYSYVRADDHRFDDDPAKINDPSVTIVSIDGDMASLIADSDFPRAKSLRLPQMSAESDFLEAIAAKKADVTFADPAMFARYEANNPGKFRRIGKPLRVFGSTIAIAKGQDEFRRMLDIATDELLADGQIEKILLKYEPAPGTLLRTAPPYLDGGSR